MKKNNTKLALAKYLYKKGYLTKTAAQNFPTRADCKKGIAAFGLEVFEMLYNTDIVKIQRVIDEIKEEGR